MALAQDSSDNSSKTLLLSYFLSLIDSKNAQTLIIEPKHSVYNLRNTFSCKPIDASSYRLLSLYSIVVRRSPLRMRPLGLDFKRGFNADWEYTLRVQYLKNSHDAFPPYKDHGKLHMFNLRMNLKIQELLVQVCTHELLPKRLWVKSPVHSTFF